MIMKLIILFNEHIPIWNSSIAIFKNNFFFGTGLKNYRKICPNKMFFNDTYPFFSTKSKKNCLAPPILITIIFNY